jgi:hypothetical protein
MRGALVVLLLLAGSARAEESRRFDGLVGLSGLFLVEHQAEPWQKNLASPYDLLYGDLRLVLDGRQLGPVDLHLDARVRLTGTFDTDAATLGQRQFVARGAIGGREYELRQAWLRVRSGKVDFAIGRLLVAESDALRLDGARVWWRFAEHWDLSFFGGGFPDPYSRSVLTDYLAHTSPFAGGASLAYRYATAWGSLSGTAASVGPGDRPRIYLTSTGWERPTSWLGLFHDLVVDVGDGRIDLTRLDVQLAFHAPHFALRLGYDRMSALAIDLYLRRLLATHPDLGYANTIANNLIIERTARDQAHGELELSFGKLTAFADGRFRQRALVGPVDPRFLAPGGEPLAPGLAGDVTLGVRDRGSLAGLRLAAAFTYLADFRTRTYLATLGVGRSFARDRVELDADFVYANGRDTLVGTACDTTRVLATCFGARAGSEYEAGLSLSAQPYSGGHFALEYRLVVDATDRQTTIFGHMIYLRFEARFSRR